MGCLLIPRGTLHFITLTALRNLGSLQVIVTVMPVGIEAWVTQIPPITRAWLALSVATSLAVVWRQMFHSQLNWRVLKQCQLVTPLQLYFSFKSAFTNAQVSCILPGAASVHADREHVVAMAHVHDILLLWIDISRLRISSFLLVSSTVDFHFQGMKRWHSWILACDIVEC